MVELKRLSPDAVDGAVALAERYRLLNEPSEAESICLDVLQVDPKNEQALVTMLLAQTDQFADGTASTKMAEAEQAARRIGDEYKRLYYSGLIRERRAKAQRATAHHATNDSVREWLYEAMSYYERAEAIRPSGHDEALLRWNACVRALNSLPAREPDTQDYQPLQSE
jgi:hypothetical protein